MTTRVSNHPVHVALQLGIAITVALSGLVHAELYMHGYRSVPIVGPAFLWQASIFVALALLIAAGGPRWLQWAAGLGSVGALVAFALSRTIGLFGFVENGWEPKPQTLVSVLAEVLTIALCVVSARQRAR